MSEKLKTDRRSFLKMASLGTAGAVAATVGVEDTNASEVRSDGSKGYSETEHVKQVYDLARF